MTEWITLLGSVASVLALAVSLYVAFAVRKIERSYLQQALLPKFTSKLKASLKNLIASIGANDEERIQTELQKCRMILKGLRTHFPRDEDTLDIIKAIDATDAPDLQNLMSNAASIQVRIEGEVERLDLLKHELQWRGRNG